MTRNPYPRREAINLFLVVLMSLLWISGCVFGARPGPPAEVTPRPTATAGANVVSFATSDAATSISRRTTPDSTPTRVPPTHTPLSPANSPTPTPTFPPRPDNENPLTGLPVEDTAVLKRRPLHVRIGNDPGARPQVGLNQADIVYEEIVEWWITRYTAVFLSQTPDTVAPIRSARLISTQLTQQYHAVLINSGGSDGVRWELSQLPIVNLDEYFWPQPYFYRPNQGWQTRLAVNAAAAYELMDRESMAEEVLLRGFVFSDEPLGGKPAQTIVIPYPKQTSEVEWRYDIDSGRYLRWVRGEPMTEFASNEQISAANVILYYAEHLPTDIVEDSNGATSIRILVNGEGRTQVFRDGVMTEGLWRADGSQTPEFVFPNGEPIPLERGNSWIEVVPTDYEIGME
jgi:hypothetical protein